VEGLVGALTDDDPSAVESAAWALGEMGALVGAPEITALGVTGQSHGDPLCREAAVAALGALAAHECPGADQGLETVLHALGDRPAIRRRAAVALAAFAHPAATAALRQCLADRDWQVRQIAEILLEGDPEPS
jgi:HEAT repeat protein